MRNLNNAGTTLGGAGFSACFGGEVSVLREDPSHRGQRWKYVHLKGNTG